MAPVFALDNLNDGGKVTLNPGPTLVNFWASWCRPCRKEMPLLQRTHRRVGTAVRFVGIDTKDQDDAATAFLRSTGVTYDIGIDKTGDVAGRYHVIGLPTTVLVGADGRVRGRVVGRLSENKLRRLLDLTTRG